MRKFLLAGFVVCALVLALPFFASADAPATGKAIGEIDVEGAASIGKEELLYLLDIKTGEILDPLKLRKGIERAFLKGIFDDILVYADSDRTDVRVVVKERERIAALDITGNEYVSTRQIEKHFPIREGDFLRHDLFDDAAGQLRAYFAERGFPGAEVSVKVSPLPEPYRNRLTITVKEGEPVLIGRISVSGAPEEETERVMKLAEGSIYETEALKKDIAAVKEHYREAGYLQPSASSRFLEGTLYVEVTLGKRLMIRYEGNTAFRTKRLGKEMPFFESGEVTEDLVEEAVRKITSLYYTKGYVSVQVAPVVSEKTGDLIEVTFFIYEGPRVTVGSIDFPGMTLTEKNLKEVLPLKAGEDYNLDLLPSTVDVVREFYIAFGYLGVEVEAPVVSIKDDAAAITIGVREGPKTLIARISITGASVVPQDEIRKALKVKEGDPYNAVDIADARLRVVDLYQGRGYLGASVIQKVEFSGTDALLALEVREGEQTVFGKTIITGNVNTKRRVIERELLHRESAPFNAGILQKERQRLLKLGLFNDVRIESLEQYDHTRDVLVHVVEGDAGSVDLTFGYSNLDKFTTIVDVGYKNLFGMNRQVALRVGYNSLEKLYAVNYTDPWFLDTPLRLKSSLFLNERDEKNIDTKVIMYHNRKYGVSLGLEKQYTSTTKGEFYFDYVINNTTDVQPDIILTDKDVGKLTVSSLRPGITYDTRDNPFDPRNGVLAGASVKIASSALFSETNFVKAVFNGSIYHELSRTFVLAAAFRFGVARAWDSSPILPLVERFFLGGRNSVRGYAQDTLGPLGNAFDPTGGNAFIETNLELRTDLGKGIGVVTFLDSGNVWQKTGDIDWSLKHTVGGGLRYNTPVGPLRIDYGYKLKKVEGLSRSEFIFSIGQAF